MPQPTPPIETFEHQVVVCSSEFPGEQLHQVVQSKEQARLFVAASWLIEAMDEVPGDICKKTLKIILQNSPDHAASVTPNTKLYTAIYDGSQFFAKTVDLPIVSHATDLLVRAKDLRQAIDPQTGELSLKSVIFYQSDRTELAKPHSRVARNSSLPEKENVINAVGGRLVVNTSSHEVLMDGKPIELAFTGYSLLAYLAQNAGRLLSRDDFYSEVWKDPDMADWSVTLQLHISQLRKLLGDEQKKMIITHIGLGYSIKA